MLIGSTVTPRLLNVDANVAGTGAFHSSCFSELNLNIDANGDRVKTKVPLMQNRNFSPLTIIKCE